MKTTTLIHPIFKSGDKHSVTNYRPISITSSIPKLLDHVVSDILIDKFAGIIIEQQHGFINGRSTVTNLLLYINFINEYINNMHQVDAIYTDFSKAFDVVNHERLLSKIWNLGVLMPLGSAFHWLESFVVRALKLYVYPAFNMLPLMSPWEFHRDHILGQYYLFF